MTNRLREKVALQTAPLGGQPAETSQIMTKCGRGASQTWPRRAETPMNLSGYAQRPDAPAMQGHRAVCAFRDLRIVGHDQRRQIFLTHQCQQFIEHAL